MLAYTNVQISRQQFNKKPWNFDKLQKAVKTSP